MNNVKNIHTKIAYNKLTEIQKAIALYSQYAQHIGPILRDSNLFESLRNVVIPPTQAQSLRLEVINGVARTRYVLNKSRKSNIHSTNNGGN